MSFKKGELLYEGKAKKVYHVEGEPNLIIQEFKNSLTAFNGEKKAEMAEKGELNFRISSLLFHHLRRNGISSHLVEVVEPNMMVCQKLTMIPLEVVVRNFVAGSLKKKFQKEEGSKIEPTLVELYYKNDGLGDPFISDEQAVWLGASNLKDIAELKTMALKVNDELFELMNRASLKLVDFKLEFGKTKSGEIVLADEISPDTCRLWDIQSGEKLDKDRFRMDLGNVVESYKEVLKRLENIREKI